MEYTKEQLLQIRKNLNLISMNALQVLKAISSNEAEINHSDIYVKAKVSKFITDKCIAAFLVSGLVTRIDDGVRRYFSVTGEGKKLLELEGEQ